MTFYKTWAVVTLLVVGVMAVIGVEVLLLMHAPVVGGIVLILGLSALIAGFIQENP